MCGYFLPAGERATVGRAAGLADGPIGLFGYVAANAARLVITIEMLSPESTEERRLEDYLDRHAKSDQQSPQISFVT